MQELCYQAIRACEVLKMDYTKIVKVLSLAATGNSIDAALDEMSKKEIEYLLELCQEEKARRQAAKNGGVCNDG